MAVYMMKTVTQMPIEFKCSLYPGAVTTCATLRGINNKFQSGFGALIIAGLEVSHTYVFVFSSSLC
jgi:hypothetical protein